MTTPKGQTPWTMFQAGVEIRLSISGIHLGMKMTLHVIQSDILIWLVWVEERTHNRHIELMTMEYIDLHSCASSHHKRIQHQVKVPMPDGTLNIDHHAARRHPLKMTRKHRSEKYKISQ